MDGKETVLEPVFFLTSPTGSCDRAEEWGWHLAQRFWLHSSKVNEQCITWFRNRCHHRSRNFTSCCDIRDLIFAQIKKINKQTAPELLLGAPFWNVFVKNANLNCQIVAVLLLHYLIFFKVFLPVVCLKPFCSGFGCRHIPIFILIHLSFI